MKALQLKNNQTCISHERLAHYVQPGTLLCLSLALYFMVLNWAEDTKSVRMSCVATVNFFVGGFYVMFFVNLQRYVVPQVVFCAAFKML